MKELIDRMDILEHKIQLVQDQMRIIADSLQIQIKQLQLRHHDHVEQEGSRLFGSN